MIKRLTAGFKQISLPSSNSGFSLTQLGSIPRFTFKYEGKPVGLKTSGNYGDLPIPCPRYFQFTKGPIDAWFFGMRASTLLIIACAWLGPVFLLPFWFKHKRELREAAEKYGPTRYGKGEVDIL